jgi:hypothetical protein
MVLAILMPVKKKFWYAIPVFVLLRKNFWNSVPERSVTKLPLPTLKATL